MFKRTLLGLTTAALFAFSLVGMSSSAQAGGYGYGYGHSHNHSSGYGSYGYNHVSYRKVVTYIEERVPYQAVVTRYDHCGHPYNAYVTLYRTVSRPVVKLVPVY